VSFFDSAAVLTLLVGLGAVAVAIAHATEPRRWSAATALGLGVGAFGVGLLGTVAGLIHGFAGVAGVDPSMKATLLAKGISEAMRSTSVGVLTLPMWLVPYVVGVVRGRRKARVVLTGAIPPPPGSIAQP
jgi:hypothetical protein